MWRVIDKMKNFFSTFFKKLCRFSGGNVSAFIALFLLALWPHAAAAQAVTLSDVVCNTIDNISPFSELMSAMAFIAGAILIGAGLLSLKDHADSPQNHPLHKGLARLAFGSALLTAPFIAQNLINTLSFATIVPGPGGGSACIPGLAPRSGRSRSWS